MAERKTVAELKKELERVIGNCNMEIFDEAIQIMHAAKGLNLKKNDEEAAKLKMVQDSELETETDGLKMAEDSAGQKEKQLETETDGCDDKEALKLKNTAVVVSGLKMAGQKEEQLETDFMEDGSDDQEAVVLESSQERIQLIKQCVLLYDPLLTPIRVESYDMELKFSWLLNKLPCSSVSEDVSVMEELLLLTSRSPYFRALFGWINWPIDKLFNPTTIKRSHSDTTLQAVVVSIVLILCRNDRAKGKIVQECSETMPFLIACLRSINTETRIVAAGALTKLSVENSLRKAIGESGVIEPVIELIEEEEGDSDVLTFACMVIWYLCSRTVENRERAVSQGVVSAVIGKIKRRIRVDEMLKVLEILSRDENAVAELEKNGMLKCLFMILREDVDEKMKEYCVVIIHNMCDGSVEKTRKIGKVENARQTLKGVASTGTPTARVKASELLSRMNTKNRRK